ncbi:TetR family transcriptional regulator [Streptomyces caniscabiei]|uniref:TetR/AcrR family transcriptional regulator n=1 Tax=Streptomyces caniscabiei TaxID=2746961 RepID=UPI0029AF2F4F|nr:TetR family transcriptional regulator [Streptomyces caniscabiei]MDX2600359.1 TetR family transcriptional regulator [Streptomyces caniscabiei]
MSTHTAAAPGPRKRDPEATRRAILDAAAEIAVEQDAAALTHRAVAARAGLALGSTTRYFESIDDLREATLRMLGDEVDAYLVQVEQDLASCDDPAECLAASMHDFLVDSRQVHAIMALITAASSNASLRSLALRFADRLTDLVAAHVGRERAVAAGVYLDGAMIHAALHDAPLSRDAVTQVLRAIFAMPETGGR